MSEKLSLVKLADLVNKSKVAVTNGFNVTARTLQRWRKNKSVPFPEGEFSIEDATAALMIVVSEMVSSSPESEGEGSLLEAKLPKVNEEIRHLQLRNEDIEVATGRREVLVSPLRMQQAMAALSARLIATYHNQIDGVVYASLRDCGMTPSQEQCEFLMPMIRERADEQWCKAVMVLHETHPLCKAFSDSIQYGELKFPIAAETVSVREWESPLIQDESDELEN